VEELSLICAAFVLITGALLAFARWRGLDYHVVNSAAVLFFCIAIFSGPASLLTPLLAVGAYAFVARDRAESQVPHDTLSLLVVIFALALAWFVLSDLLARNTIFAFNAAFAALAVALVAAFHARAGFTPWLLGATVAVAWTGAMVRVASDHRSLALDLLPSAGDDLRGHVLRRPRERGSGGVLLREWREHPWAKLGVASLLAGLVALPMSPG
jgi:hypothetical protein